MPRRGGTRPKEHGAQPAETRAEETPEPTPVETEVAELREQIAGLQGQWRRALADLENLRKRTAREAAQVREDERARVAAEWLPVLDHLDLALEHATADPSTIVAGVAAVREQALGVLERLGFPRRSDLGTRFDPSQHEAVATAPDADTPAGTVIQVIRPGYGGDERQLRPAAVVVATGKD